MCLSEQKIKQKHWRCLIRGEGLEGVKRSRQDRPMEWEGGTGPREQVIWVMKMILLADHQVLARKMMIQHAGERSGASTGIWSIKSSVSINTVKICFNDTVWCVIYEVHLLRIFVLFCSQKIVRTCWTRLTINSLTF